MKVKVCPKCGSENKETNESCSSCYASLAGVESTESAKAPMVLPPAPAKAAEPPKAETPAPPPQAPPSPYGPPPGPIARPGGYTPGYRERAAPVKQGSSVGLIVFILILLAGGAGAGWWFLLKPQSPGEVVQGFAAAAQSNDPEKIKSYLSQSTMNMPGFAEGFARGQELAAKNPKPKDDVDVRVNVLSTVYEGAEKDTAIVTFEPEDKSKAPTGMGMGAKQELVLVKEDGKWKIDLPASIQRAVTKALGGGSGTPRGGGSAAPQGGRSTAPRSGG